MTTDCKGKQFLLNCWSVSMLMGENFLGKIRTGDETRAHHFEPGAKKKQPMEWHHSQSPRRKSFNTIPLTGKVMSALFWDL
jgi:hypothetical protein